MLMLVHQGFEASAGKGSPNNSGCDPSLSLCLQTLNILRFDFMKLAFCTSKQQSPVDLAIRFIIIYELPRMHNSLAHVLVTRVRKTFLNVSPNMSLGMIGGNSKVLLSIVRPERSNH